MATSTRQGDSAIDFYGKVFGWTTITEDLGGGPYTMFQVGGRNVAGMLRMEGDDWPADMPSHWMTYFAVDDCDASAAKVAELGGAVSVPPTDIPVGRFSVVNDPQGVVFTIIKMNQFDPGP